MTFEWGYYGDSTVWFLGISKGIRKNVYGIPRRFLLDFHKVSMDFLQHFYGISVGFLWGFL